VPSQTEVLRNRTIGGEEPLRVSGRFAALHAPLPLTRRLMGILRTVLEIAVQALLHTGQYVPLGGLLLSLSVTLTRGTYFKPLSSLRKNFFAAFLLRRLCTGISRTWLS
jgi:hypothetical protein